LCTFRACWRDGEEIYCPMRNLRLSFLVLQAQYICCTCFLLRGFFRGRENRWGSSWGLVWKANGARLSTRVEQRWIFAIRLPWHTPGLVNWNLRRLHGRGLERVAVVISGKRIERHVIHSAEQCSPCNSSLTASFTCWYWEYICECHGAKRNKLVWTVYSRLHCTIWFPVFLSEFSLKSLVKAYISRVTSEFHLYNCKIQISEVWRPKERLESVSKFALMGYRYSK
jgi:hypothetical protein